MGAEEHSTRKERTNALLSVLAQRTQDQYWGGMRNTETHWKLKAGLIIVINNLDLVCNLSYLQGFSTSLHCPAHRSAKTKATLSLRGYWNIALRIKVTWMDMKHLATMIIKIIWWMTCDNIHNKYCTCSTENLGFVMGCLSSSTETLLLPTRHSGPR